MFGVDPAIMLGGLVAGFVVGLTGMGGGALMTPMLVLLFKVDPLSAVGSDLVVSLFMKPVGGAIHARRGTVRWDIVKWLAVGSVPAAFGGVLILRAIGAERVDDLLKNAIGITLLAAAGAMILRARLRSQPGSVARVGVEIVPTIAIGALGGLLVGLTSVGSGSVIIVLLMLVYPGLTASEMVGTDLVQAVPLVGAAALGHVLFGQVELGLTASLLLGGLPGVIVGAHFSSMAAGRVVRPALFLLLVSSGLKLVQVI
jgi:uncharacterized membrane protein YfcA